MPFRLLGLEEFGKSGCVSIMGKETSFYDSDVPIIRELGSGSGI